MTAHRRNCGFTLLEVLAGLAIFALIAGTAYAALHSASRVWVHADARAQEYRDSWLALDYLRRQLAGAVPLGVSAGGNYWRLWFDGQADQVMFVAEGSRHVGISGLIQFTVSRGAQTRPPGLMLSMQRVDDRFRMRAAHDGALRRLLIAGVEQVDFAFFGSKRPGEAPSWYSQWRNVQSLPQLVRIRLSDGTAEWPDLVVRLRADGLRLYKQTGAISPDHAS